MTVDLILHGVPNGQDIWGVSDDTHYISTFYVQKDEREYLSIEARNCGYYVAFAPNIICEEEYPIDYVAFKKRHSKFGYANIVYLPWNAGGLSMGLFIFMKDQHRDKKWTHDTRIHEYGHTWQCLLLGPLYYIVIALPSVIWCNCFASYRKKNNVSYYKLYCESWANSFGEKFTGLKRVNDK